MIRKRWKFRNENVSADMVSRGVKCYGIPEIIARVLLNRNIGLEDFRAFLSKSKSSILNPMSMLDMDKAAKRVARAIKEKESIVVYGDYDVDGITSTALLYDFLKSCGADVSYYIPDRMDEGYGINIMAVNSLIKQGVKLLVTVDCGITAVGEVEFAKLQGMDVVITDHHTCKDRIPEAADAVVNPKREDDAYEFEGLAGVGVAFKLVMAVAMELGMSAGDCFDEYVDLAAIGTVADVVPLVNENRVIVEKGLAQLRNTKRCGIKALLRVAGVEDKKVTATTIAFAIAPRINASGRIGNPKRAVELLLTKDTETADCIAGELNFANKERQETELEISRQVMEMIEKDKDFDDKKVVVLAKEGWHNGVIGIVASRVTEKYYKPCILISLTDGTGKGSGRSIEGFNLFDALGACENILTTFGGHAAAAGLAIEGDRVEEFSAAINKYADELLTDEDMVPVVKIDAILDGDSLNIDTARKIAGLEPFGMGNETPVFATKNARVLSCSGVGADSKHLRLQIEKNNVRVNCIGFGMGDMAKELRPGDGVHIAYKLDINTYQGRESLQLVLSDIKPIKN